MKLFANIIEQAINQEDDKNENHSFISNSIISCNESQIIVSEE